MTVKRSGITKSKATRVARENKKKQIERTKQFIAAVNKAREKPAKKPQPKKKTKEG